MITVDNPSHMKNLSLTWRKAGKTVGLVPTMGALHRGHLSLIETARRRCDLVVTSIFVNPIQFGPLEDFSRYPRPFDKDCRAAEDAGCDVLFAPDRSGMYPKDYSTYVNVEDITNGLCGASRPGHFKGVATVVLKLFNVVSPQIAVFGQKDAQQCLVIRRMVRDLDCSVELLFAPTVREADGLAMSSRNSYLSAEERNQAVHVFRGLSVAQSLFRSGERGAAAIRESILRVLLDAPLLSIEYVEIVNMESVLPVETLDAPALAAVAVRTKETKTRLIDNILLGGTF